MFIVELKLNEINKSESGKVVEFLLIHHETLMKRSWNVFETVMKRSWNADETILKRLWNDFETVLKRTWNASWESEKICCTENLFLAKIINSQLLNSAIFKYLLCIFENFYSTIIFRLNIKKVLEFIKAVAIRKFSIGHYIKTLQRKPGPWKNYRNHWQFKKF